MLVDLHVHTNRSSYCSGLSPQELIEKALRLGLDAVAVTEHSTHRGAQIAYEMAEGSGLVVFRGIEVYTDKGDMLVFGMSSRVGTDMDFEELYGMVRAEGGLIIAAHPTRGFWGHHRKYKGETPLEVLRRLDGMETHNGGCPPERNERAVELARELGIASVGGSDAHMHYSVGKCVTVLERFCRSEEELMEELRAGRCRGAYLEELEREPQPRVLPR